MTSHGGSNTNVLGYPTYRPVRPYRRLHSYAVPPYQRWLLETTQSHIRMFSSGLVGFTFVLLLCLSPAHWVQFTVLKDKQQLSAGLWTLCHNDLCWSNTPRAPYYLQYSRALFLISALAILIIIIWLSISLTKGTGDKTYIDLGISIFCFISGTCLLLCLILFLMQVKLCSRSILEPHFLLFGNILVFPIIYRLNWWGSIFYVTVGFLSGLSHLSSQVSPQDQDLIVVPVTRTRIGNTATVNLGLTERNVGISPLMSQTPERRSSSVTQSRSQTEAGSQTELETQIGPETQKVIGTQTKPEAQTESRTQREPEIGNESVITDGLITQARLATDVEPVDMVKPRPEAEITTGNVTSDVSSSRLESK